MPSEEYGITPNKCHTIPYLLADGMSQHDLAMFWMVDRSTVNHHAQRKCSCPELDEPAIGGLVLATEIAELRRWTGWSCDQLARKLGVREAQVRRWLNGYERVDAATSRRIYELREQYEPEPAQLDLVSATGHEVGVDW